MEVLWHILVLFGVIYHTSAGTLYVEPYDKEDVAGVINGDVVEMVQYHPHRWPTPPPWPQKAHMARYLVHYADWCVVSSLSKDLGGVPFGEVESFADGTLTESSGTPYFYFAEISTMMENIKYNNRVSITITLAQSHYCDRHHMDPELPPCARITLTGKMLLVEGDEVKTAKSYLFARHPDMVDWPAGHGWTLYKLEISAIFLLDFYGGATHLSVEDYYNNSTLSDLV